MPFHWSQTPQKLLLFVFLRMTHLFIYLVGTNGSSGPPLSEGDKENKTTDDDEKGAFKLPSGNKHLLFFSWLIPILCFPPQRTERLNHY